MGRITCRICFAIVIAVISLLVRPRSAGASKPVDIMLQHVDAVSIAVLLTPFAKIGGQKGAKRRGSDLSDDEELEKSRSNKDGQPLTVWSKPTISILKFPKCCAMCSRFPKR